MTVSQPNSSCSFEVVQMSTKGIYTVMMVEMACTMVAGVLAGCIGSKGHQYEWTADQARFLIVTTEEFLQS